MSHQDTMIPEVFTLGRFCRIADGPDKVCVVAGQTDRP